jgi:hypothetical protein
MTHRFPRSLLEDYVDNELSEKEAEQFRRLLAESPELRDEYLSAVRLKELLRQIRSHDPGEEYWPEVTGLILARTTGLQTEEKTIDRDNEQSTQQRAAFYRALLSAAAALVIFFSALLLGSSERLRMSGGDTTPGPVFFAASLAEEMDADDPLAMTKAERATTTAAMLLLGSPSHVGRFSGLPALFADK